MSATTDAYFAMQCLFLAVDEQIAGDIQDKVTKAVIELQTEVDEWRAKAIAADMRLKIINEKLAHRDRRDLIAQIALEAGKTALDDLVALQFPEESGYFPVMQAHSRIDPVGTVGYVSEVLQKIRTAQNAFKIA